MNWSVLDFVLNVRGSLSVQILSVLVVVKGRKVVLFDDDSAFSGQFSPYDCSSAFAASGHVPCSRYLSPSNSHDAVQPRCRMRR